VSITNLGRIVTKFFKIFSIVIIATIFILVVIGILAPKSTYFTKTQIIKSPISVVWRKLVDVENYPTWQPSIKRVEIKNGSTLSQGKNLRFYMAEYDSTVYHETEIIKYENDKTFTFARTGNNVSPLLKEYQTTYSLKRLLDGTTEISVTISYQTIGLITKIYNQVLLRGRFISRSERNLALLKYSIEQM
jgi:uncharacterized membrane protein